MGKERVITEEMLEGFAAQLAAEEKSRRTVGKYVRDVRKLACYAGEREVTKGLVVAYKEKLIGEGRYRASSINTFLVAANRFLAFMGWDDARVRTCRVQRTAFAAEGRCLGREEYGSLVEAAHRAGRQRLALILMAICATGIRVGELGYFTAGSVIAGKAVVRGKGRTREVLIPSALQGRLLEYMVANGISEGPVFRTAGGKPVDRSNLWRDMRSLCGDAGVDPGKAHPHSLRHLFARCFHAAVGDIARLADVLGHGSIETTRIYTRTPCEEHRAQLEGLGLVF